MKTFKLGLCLLLAAVALPAQARTGKKSGAAKSSRTARTARAGNTARVAIKSTSTTPSGVVNINVASASEIAFLPRVGAKAAQRIVDYRKQNGNFHRAEDLMQVKGVGEKLFDALKPYLAVEGPTTLTAKVKSTGSRSHRSARLAKKA